jgi:hypothetical protein
MAFVGGIVERQGRSRSADILGLDSEGRLLGVELSVDPAVPFDRYVALWALSLRRRRGRLPSESMGRRCMTGSPVDA